MELGRLSSGIPDLDSTVGGLIPGDNIVWVTDHPNTSRFFEEAFLAAGAHEHRTCVYVHTDLERHDTPSLDSAIIQVDARPGKKDNDLQILEEALVEIARAHPRTFVVVDGLDALVHRWGPARVAAFYGRTCPRLFDLGAVAYWRVSPSAMGSSLDQIRRVAQCVFEVTEHEFKISKAEGRPSAIQGRIYQMGLRDGVPVLSSERALGRIGRGLRQLRRQRNLSQLELAGFAGVTASAISQAESGRRGLSLDTLLVLGERLGIGVDALLDDRPTAGYVLARCPATGAQVTPLFDDPDQGLVVHLVRLAPGAEGVPPYPYKGTELIAVAAGLIQLRVGTETPVMRAGDAVLATRDPVHGWRNLIAEPALLYLILKS